MLRDKYLIGIGLACLLLNVTLLPIVFTGAVEGAVEDKFETFISRIREDSSQPNSINLWVVSDNLLKGAALNAVEIAESLIEKDFYGK